MKTTPKPRATKKRSGELVGPLLLWPGGDVVDAGGAIEAVLEVDMVDEDDEALPGNN